MRYKKYFDKRCYELAKTVSSVVYRNRFVEPLKVEVKTKKTGKVNLVVETVKELGKEKVENIVISPVVTKDKKELIKNRKNK